MSILFSRNTIVIFFYSAYLCYNSLYYVSLEKGISIIGGLFNITSISATFSIFILVLASIITILTSYYPRKVWKAEDSIRINQLMIIAKKNIYNQMDIDKVINKNSYSYKVIEYGLLMLFVITGAIFFMNTNDLISLFLGIELQSYGLYLMCCLWRDSEKAISAGLTYFLLGALSSCLILLGTVMLYISLGTSNLDVMYSLINILKLNDYSYNGVNLDQNIYSINIAFTLIGVGFLFKISAAPFHFWSPDVYDKIPTIVTTFVAIVSKISILVFFLTIISYESKVTSLNSTIWTYIIIISSFLSLIIGTVLGLKEARIKRLLAYSTVSHIGFILLSMSVNTLMSVQAFVFYLITYSISNLNVFLFVIMIGYSLYYHVYDKKEAYGLKDRNSSPIQLLSELKGYFYLNPVICLGLTITIFSFIGVPPLIGFFAKQMVLASALSNGYIFLSLIAILTSVVGAVYYLGIIKYMFFDTVKFKQSISYKHYLTKDINKQTLNLNYKKESLETSNLNKEYSLFNFENVKLSSSLTFVTSFLTLLILTFILTPEESLNLSNIISLTVFSY